MYRRRFRVPGERRVMQRSAGAEEAMLAEIAADGNLAEESRNQVQCTAVRTMDAGFFAPGADNVHGETSRGPEAR